MTKTLASQAAADIDRHLGRSLSRRRRELEISAADLDKVISAPPGSVTRLEAGKQGITAAQLFTLSRALDVPVLYFFEGLAALPKGASIDVPVAENVAGAERFLDAYSKISDARVRREILGLVKAAGG